MDGFSPTTLFFFSTLVFYSKAYDEAFQIKFKISLSISTKDLAEILIEKVTLNV